MKKEEIDVCDRMSRWDQGISLAGTIASVDLSQWPVQIKTQTTFTCSAAGKYRGMTFTLGKMRVQSFGYNAREDQQ